MIATVLNLTNDGLRLILYTYYFEASLPALASSTWWRRAHRLTNYMNQSKDRIHLLQTSRLILREALPVYHAALEFHVMNIHLFLRDVQCAMQLRISQIKENEAASYYALGRHTSHASMECLKQACG